MSNFKKGNEVVRVSDGKAFTYEAGAGRGKSTLLGEDGTTIVVGTKEILHASAYRDQQAKAAAKAEKAKSKPAKKEKAAKPKKDKPAKKAKVKTAEGEAVTSGALTYVPDRYTKHDTKTASGGKVRDVADQAAEELRELSLDKAYIHVAKACGVKTAELKEKYEHLNAGMQRMNLGNRLRGAYRAAEAAAE